MDNNFLAELKTCLNCGKEYMPAHQSADCPHERLIDIEPKPSGRLLTEKDLRQMLADEYNLREAELLPDCPEDRNHYAPENIHTWPNGLRDLRLALRVVVKCNLECQARIEALIEQLKDNAELIIIFCNKEKARANVDKDALIITMRDMIHDMVVGIITEAECG